MWNFRGQDAGAKEDENEMARIKMQGQRTRHIYKREGRGKGEGRRERMKLDGWWLVNQG